MLHNTALVIWTVLCLSILQYLTQPSQATSIIKTTPELDDYDPSSSVSDGHPPRKSTSLLLTRILEDPEQAKELVRLIEALEGRRRAGEAAGALHGARESDETRKREAAWDMDYGWGGGRFGKRMDSLGMAGRFGRSVEKATEKLEEGKL